MLALACLLAGCSSVRLAYNNVPTFGTWWLDRYLDFDDAQSAQLREELAGLQQWHRSTQLPELAGLLQRAQVLAAQQHIEPAQACVLVDEVQQQLEALGTHSEPRAAQLARSLSPAQLQHLEARYVRTNADFREEWLDIDPAQMRAKRYDKMLERAEHFYGRLDPDQRDLLRREVQASSYDPARQQTERLRRQQDTLQTLRPLVGAQASVEQAESALHGLFVRYRQSPQPQYRAYAQRLLTEGCAGFAALHATTTQAQRDSAVQRLQSYERDFRALAARD